MNISRRGWVAVTVSVQVGGALHRARRWGVGEKDRALDRTGYGWGAGRRREDKNS